MNYKKISLVVMLLLLTIFSCKKDDNQKVKFGWAKNGSVYFYDQYKSSGVFKNYLKLSIYDNQFFQNNAGTFTVMDILERHFVIKKGGLFGLACEDCNFGFLGCSREFEFLYAPNSPSLNQDLPIYGCGKTPNYNIGVIKTDTTIVVPYGTFNTYIMKHRNGDKSYWNADNGIIMYEKVDFRDSKTVVETFKLSRKGI